MTQGLIQASQHYFHKAHKEQNFQEDLDIPTVDIEDIIQKEKQSSITLVGQLKQENKCHESCTINKF